MNNLKPKFSKNTKYYTGVVYEWNLPAGWACPFAKECLVKVDKESGKFNILSKSFRCYAANAERFPAVREARWNNFEYAKRIVKEKGTIEVPKRAKAVRIHASGDFFSQEYFDVWLRTAEKYPDKEFWAFTKSVKFWVNRLDRIPPNLMLTASYGGKDDGLIKEYGLKSTIVVSPDKVKPASYEEFFKQTGIDVPNYQDYVWVKIENDGYEKVYPVDSNDDWARISVVPATGVDFVLIDNFKVSKKKEKEVLKG